MLSCKSAHGKDMFCNPIASSQMHEALSILIFVLWKGSLVFTNHSMSARRVTHNSSSSGDDFQPHPMPELPRCQILLSPNPMAFEIWALSQKRVVFQSRQEAHNQIKGIIAVIDV